MSKKQFNIQIIHDEERNTQSWIMSEMQISDEIVKKLQRGHYDYLGISIHECPVFVFLVSAHDTAVGNITKETVFVHPRSIEMPISPFLINSKFIDLLEGEKFFEQISQLAPLLDADMTAFIQESFTEWNKQKGLHCIATLRT